MPLATLRVYNPENLVMNSLCSVFILQHLHVLDNGEEDVKLIGAYESRKAAEDAVERLAVKPGFRDRPHIVDPDREDQEDGFYISELTVGEDHWTSGYVTIPYGEV